MTPEHKALTAQLRKAADEMRAEDQNGWPVVCDTAAAAIEALSARGEVGAVGWVPWKKGKCPVAPGTAGEVQVEDGEIVASDDIAGFGWNDEPVPGRRIVAYRLSPAPASDEASDLRAVLKSVLYHFGPEGAQKVTADALSCRHAPVPDAVETWDTEATADRIARQLAAEVKSFGPTGRIHGGTYNAAKAGALAAFECVKATLASNKPVGDGYVLVPKTPTQAMMDAADRARPLPEIYILEIWTAMLAASGEPNR